MVLRESILFDPGAAIARVPCVLRGETGGLGEVTWSPNGMAIALSNNNETVGSNRTVQIFRRNLNCNFDQIL